MPNQLNYFELHDTRFQQPSRISSSELTRLVPFTQDSEFGALATDNVEIWVYNPDGSFAGHTTLRLDSPLLKLVSVVDVARTYGVLAIDFEKTFQRMGILPGYYPIVVNVFRDEIGSEAEPDQLEITQISSDRTEVIISPVDGGNVRVATQVKNFLEPGFLVSDSRIILDMMFGKIPSPDPNLVLDLPKLRALIESVQENGPITAQILEFRLEPTYTELLDTILTMMYPVAKDQLENRVSVRRYDDIVQNDELVLIIMDALTQVISVLVASNRIPRQFTGLFPNL